MYVSESGRAVVASSGGDFNRSPTRAGFHHDEVTLVLLVLNSLSNYIQSYARIISAAVSYGICAYICVSVFFPFRSVSYELLSWNLLCFRINFFRFFFLFSLGNDIQCLLCVPRKKSPHSPKDRYENWRMVADF